MPSIMCKIPNTGDATSLYRGMGPLAEMRRQMGDKLNVMITDDYHWATINIADCVFMQRPFQGGDVTIAEITKAMHKPLWVDYDDDLFNVPTDNPAHSIYNDETIQKNVAKIINMADLVTVTTPHLKRQFELTKRPLNKNIHVVPNALDFHLFPYREETMNPRNRVVMWRGSITHTRDVMTYSDQILKQANDPKYKEWVWRFIGDNLWFITDFMPKNNAVWSKAIDPIEYFKHIYDISPMIIQVPLHESSFNKSKSNIAWIEGTFAGAATIAPDWEEWRHPGVLLYKNKEEYANLLDSAMSGKIDLAKNVKESWEHVKENFNLAKWATRRLELLREINALRF